MTSMKPSAPPGAGQFAGQIVADRADPVAAEPQVGADLGAGLGGHGEGLQLAGGGRRGLAERAGQHQLYPDRGELAAQLGLQVVPEPGAEDVIGHVEQGHVLARPGRLDLAGQLDADRPGADQQHPLRRSQRGMGGPDLAVRGGGAVGVALGRERVVGPGRQHDVVGRNLLAGGERHPAGLDLGGPALDDPAAGQQPVVGQVDPRQPGRIGQGAEAGHVMHEVILRLHEHDIGHVIEDLGRVYAGVTAADDHDGRPGRGRLAHAVTPEVSAGRRCSPK